MAWLGWETMIWLRYATICPCLHWPGNDGNGKSIISWLMVIAMVNGIDCRWWFGVRYQESIQLRTVTCWQSRSWSPWRVAPWYARHPRRCSFQFVSVRHLNILTTRSITKFEEVEVEDKPLNMLQPHEAWRGWVFFIVEINLLTQGYTGEKPPPATCELHGPWANLAGVGCSRAAQCCVRMCEKWQT